MNWWYICKHCQIKWAVHDCDCMASLFFLFIAEHGNKCQLMTAAGLWVKASKMHLVIANSFKSVIVTDPDITYITCFKEPDICRHTVWVNIWATATALCSTRIEVRWRRSLCNAIGTQWTLVHVFVYYLWVASRNYMQKLPPGSASSSHLKLVNQTCIATSYVECDRGSHSTVIVECDAVQQGTEPLCSLGPYQHPVWPPGGPG